MTKEAEELIIQEMEEEDNEDALEIDELTEDAIDCIIGFNEDALDYTDDDGILFPQPGE